MIKKQLYSYLYGLFGTDGAVYLNSNNNIYRFSIELIDNDIIEQINTVLENCSTTKRIRNTNFKDNGCFYGLYAYNREFLTWCENNNFPKKDKTNTLNTPIDYDEDYFWHGVIDGDGSLGMKKNENQPFLNLTTKSENLKEAFLDYIEKYTNFRPNIHRNQRDKLYNITLHGEKCLIILNRIYKNYEIGISRKFNTYNEIKGWAKKPIDYSNRKKWTKEEEQDLLNLTKEQFIEKYPYRTLAAVKGKIQRMKKQLGGD